MVSYKYIVNCAMTDKIVMVLSIRAVSNSTFFGSLHQVVLTSANTLLCVAPVAPSSIHCPWKELSMLDTGQVVQKIAATSLHKICLVSGISSKRDYQGHPMWHF